jgi:hypothetical protein
MDATKAFRTAAIALGSSIALVGCSKENILPVTELPKKPLSSSIKCERLTDAEKAGCLLEAQEARNVCRKVERNEAICSDQQDFVKRLYEARDGK